MEEEAASEYGKGGYLRVSINEKLNNGRYIIKRKLGFVALSHSPLLACISLNGIFVADCYIDGGCFPPSGLLKIHSKHPPVLCFIFAAHISHKGAKTRRTQDLPVRQRDV